MREPKLGFVKGMGGAKEKTFGKKQVFWCRILEWDL